ncbi:hypothetical protein G7Y89_g7063 [Cudoniella acicularis]|uniref:nitrilase n=1 Tax=Cudoniella acicularis TaxID=354080 RepID=A0A8H4RMS0_9HELO|nr:hypothetical protein G7Y89_g7063 [Cudoniella acicularis]
MPATQTGRIVRVAATQLASVDFDLDACVDKACKAIVEASEKGCQLIGFSECFIPGYPFWIWKRAVDFGSVKKYIANSLKVDSPEMKRICETAKEHNIAVQLGFSENDNQSLYISQALIGQDGEIKKVRRKTKPTHMERTIFGDSSGDSLLNVIDLPGIGKVGGLNCWEHTQPLLRYHTYTQGEEFHVAAWPPMLSAASNPDIIWSTVAEGSKALSQTHSIEGGTFTLYCNAVLQASTCTLMDVAGAPLYGLAGGGYTAIYGPDGAQISKSTLGPEEEGLVIADCDIDEITRNKHFLDTYGHYSRPDLLWLGVDYNAKPHVRATPVVKADGGSEGEPEWQWKMVRRPKSNGQPSTPSETDDGSLV